MSRAGGLRPATSYDAVVGQVLAALRQQAGSSQAEVARAVGVAQSTWSRIERGHQVLNLHQLRAASEFFGAQPSEVLRHAERAADHCQAEGVRVTPAAVDPATAGLIAIGVGALAVLVVAALTSE